MSLTVKLRNIQSIGTKNFRYCLFLKKVLKTIRFQQIFVSPTWIILKRFFRRIGYRIFCHIQFIGNFVSSIRYRVFAVLIWYFNMCAHVDVVVVVDVPVNVDMAVHVVVVCVMNVLLFNVSFFVVFTLLTTVDVKTRTNFRIFK